MLVTQGSEGCNNHAQNLGRSYTHLGFKVNAVDVCGAGDMFLAGLVYASTFTTNIKQQLDVANAYAAISVAKAGIYVPTKQELIEFLQERGL
jgi:ribokinase